MLPLSSVPVGAGDIVAVAATAKVGVAVKVDVLAGDGGGVCVYVEVWMAVLSGVAVNVAVKVRVGVHVCVTVFVTVDVNEGVAVSDGVMVNVGL